jgi:hypothetical protein
MKTLINIVIGFLVFGGIFWFCVEFKDVVEWVGFGIITLFILMMICGFAHAIGAAILEAFR